MMRYFCGSVLSDYDSSLAHLQTYSEHQWKVTNHSRTFYKGTLLVLSEQRTAVISAFIFVVYSPVPCIGTTENGIRHEWNHDMRSLTSTSCFHWFLWEIAKLWCFLKIGASLSLFDGIIETISMAFSWNIFQIYNRMFIFENNVFKFWKAKKSTKCTCSSCSIVTGLTEQIYYYRRVCSIPETRNVK